MASTRYTCDYITRGKICGKACQEPAESVLVALRICRECQEKRYANGLAKQGGAVGNG